MKKYLASLVSKQSSFQFEAKFFSQFVIGCTTNEPGLPQKKLWHRHRKLVKGPLKHKPIQQRARHGKQWRFGGHLCPA